MSTIRGWTWVEVRQCVEGIAWFVVGILGPILALAACSILGEVVYDNLH